MTTEQFEAAAKLKPRIDYYNSLILSMNAAYKQSVLRFVDQVHPAPETDIDKMILQEALKQSIDTFGAFIVKVHDELLRDFQNL